MSSTGVGSSLRRARDRHGWSQTTAMRKFEGFVAEQGSRSPTGASLKRMFAYWESGERAVTVAVYRRAFMTMYGCSSEELGFDDSAGGVPSGVTRDLETLCRDLNDVLEEGVAAESIIDDWERLVQRYGRATRDRSAPHLLVDLREDLGDLHPALSAVRSPSGRRRLTCVLAQMSGLVLLTLIKLDDRAAWRRWARTARVASAEAGDRTTESWVLAQEAYGHFYGDDLAAAVDVAEHAQALCTDHGSVGAPLASALEARAHAAMGNRTATGAALRRAEEFVSYLEPSDRQASAFGYNEAQLFFHASSAYTHLGDVTLAFEAQDRALALCPPSDYTDRALVHLDRAACLTLDRQGPAAAQEIATTLSSLDPPQRQGIIERRAREVIAGLPEDQRRQGAVRDLEDLILPLRKEAL